jgi:Protein of unknown function (DUF3309)
MVVEPSSRCAVETATATRRAPASRLHALDPTTGALMLTTVLLIVLILLLIGAIPSWPYSRGWGYGPSGILGVVLIVVLILALTGRV